MSFIWNTLPGSFQRPDIETIVVKEKGKDLDTDTGYCSSNVLGYLPVVSTITGLGRTLLGIVHTIVHLACSIFSKNRDHHFQEVSLGAKNIGRGLIEAIPIIGNITMFIVDIFKKSY